MSGINVKNTMVERVLQLVAPHPCSGCGKLGLVVCEDCKYDIIHEPFLGCILCGQPNSAGICLHHHSSIERALTLATREGTLETTINRLKFQNVKAAGRSLAELMDAGLPILPSDIHIVPVPTVPSHARRRGYDQVDVIARHLSQLRDIPLIRPLRRLTSDTQHLVDRAERERQAARAFALQPNADMNGVHVLLVDDVVTTGATLQAAADCLKMAGAKVWVAALAYQPLD